MSEDGADGKILNLLLLPRMEEVSVSFEVDDKVPVAGQLVDNVEFHRLMAQTLGLEESQLCLVTSAEFNDGLWPAIVLTDDLPTPLDFKGTIASLKAASPLRRIAGFKELKKTVLDSTLLLAGGSIIAQLNVFVQEVKAKNISQASRDVSNYEEASREFQRAYDLFLQSTDLQAFENALNIDTLPDDKVNSFHDGYDHVLQALVSATNYFKAVWKASLVSAGGSFVLNSQIESLQKEKAAMLETIKKLESEKAALMSENERLTTLLSEEGKKNADLQEKLNSFREMVPSIDNLFSENEALRLESSNMSACLDAALVTDSYRRSEYESLQSSVKTMHKAVAECLEEINAVRNLIGK